VIRPEITTAARLIRYARSHGGKAHLLDARHFFIGVPTDEPQFQKLASQHCNQILGLLLTEARNHSVLPCPHCDSLVHADPQIATVSSTQPCVDCAANRVTMARIFCLTREIFRYEMPLISMS